MNAANLRDADENGIRKETQGLAQGDPSLVLIWDAKNRHIRCVLDRQKGIRYINELAKKDAVTVLMN